MITELKKIRSRQKEAELERIERELGVSDGDFEFGEVNGRIRNIDNFEIDE